MAIVKLWVRKLESGEKAWEDVPDKRKNDVKALLKEDVAAGKITAADYKEITGEKYAQ